MQINKIQYNKLESFIRRDTQQLKDVKIMDSVGQQIYDMEKFISAKFKDFKYPSSFKEMIPLIEEKGWDVPLGNFFIEQEIYGLQRRYNITSLVPFAKNQDATEYACFVINSLNNTIEKVVVINSFGDRSKLYLAQYNNIEEWIKEWL